MYVCMYVSLLLQEEQEYIHSTKYMWYDTRAFLAKISEAAHWYKAAAKTADADEAAANEELHPSSLIRKTKPQTPNPKM